MHKCFNFAELFTNRYKNKLNKIFSILNGEQNSILLMNNYLKINDT